MPIDPATRLELERMAREGLDHARAGTMSLAEGVMELDASLYTDPGRFQAEIARIFRRVPLMLAMSCEISSPGDYKTIEVAGVPVLIMRGKDGTARAMLNACTHRGALLAEGCGHAGRFTCPYHGWSFAHDGQLLAVASPQDFGEVDKSALGLRQFPTFERAGMVFVILDPDSTLDIDSFLGPFGAMLEGFGFGSWHLLEQRSVPGTNWKLAHDAHSDWYHLPVLHRDSFGPQTGNRALYSYFGAHHRMFRPEPEVPPPLPQNDLYRQRDRVPSDWSIEALMVGGWLIFPNITLYALYRGGRRLLNLNQIMPGSHVGESLTIQLTLCEEQPDEDLRDAARKIADMVEQVVRDEDLANSARQQRALESGLLPKVRFGRNEGGNQHFHRWFDQVIATPDKDLAALFAKGG